MRMLAWGILLLGAIGTATYAGADEERIVLKVSPAVSFAPANLVVRATIPADAANRAVTIVAESQDFYRSSDVQIDGDRGPRTSVVEFRSLPRGYYDVRAILRDGSGRERATAHQLVNVVASGVGN